MKCNVIFKRVNYKYMEKLNITSKRNAGVEVLRFVFAVVILLGHAFSEFGSSKTPFGVIRQGAIGVEFFFVLSGILMAKSVFDNGIHHTNITVSKATPAFIAKKYLAVFPTHLITYIIMLGELIYYNNLDSVQALKKVTFSLPEVFLVHMSGIKLSIVNQNVWYISAMLFAMLIIYHVLLRYKALFTRVISPILFLTIFGFIYQSTGSLTPSSEVVAGGLALKGTLRAVAEISLGTTVYEFIVSLNKTELTVFAKHLIRLVELSCYVLTIFVSMTTINIKWYFVFVFMLSVGLAITFSKYSISAKVPPLKPIVYLGSLSMTVFVCQRAVLYPLSELMLFRSYRFNTLAFFIGTIALSVFLKCVLDFAENRIKDKSVFVQAK